MLDHLVYVASNLDAACDDLEKRLGVRPAYGGAHTGRGTHNALLGLGDRRYLEVIAPDPGQPEPAEPRRFAVGEGPDRLVTWCIEPRDLEETVAGAREAGYEPGEVVWLRRRRPDGVALRWRVVSHAPDFGRAGDGLVPFLIDWRGSPHPSAAAPAGVRVAGLHGEHPDPEAVAALLDAIGAGLPLRRGARPALVAHLSTPRGPVELR